MKRPLTAAALTHGATFTVTLAAAIDEPIAGGEVDPLRGRR